MCEINRDQHPIGKVAEYLSIPSGAPISAPTPIVLSFLLDPEQRVSLYAHVAVCERTMNIIRPKHRMVVPGLGVFIAPKAVARLFQLHDYTCCPNFRKKRAPMGRILYPLLRPNVYYSPRMFHLHQARRFKNEKRKDGQ